MSEVGANYFGEFNPQTKEVFENLLSESLKKGLNDLRNGQTSTIGKCFLRNNFALDVCK